MFCLRSISRFAAYYNLIWILNVTKYSWPCEEHKSILLNFWFTISVFHYVTKCWKIFPLLCFASLPSDCSLPSNLLYWIPLSEAYIFHCNIFSIPYPQCFLHLIVNAKILFCILWKGFMYIKYPQSQLEGFHKEILFNIKLYQSSIKASLSLTLHTAPHSSLQFAYLTLKELYGKSKQRFQSKAKISSTFCWKFYSISNPWESLLEQFCSIRKRRTLV